MTPAPQHCAHECVCTDWAGTGKNCMDPPGCRRAIKFPSLYKKTGGVCPHDTRKAAAIAEHEGEQKLQPLGCTCNKYATCKECFEHDARVRKEERELMISEVELLSQKCRWFNWCTNYMHGECKRPCEWFTHLSALKVLESLRRGEHQ